VSEPTRPNHTELHARIREFINENYANGQQITDDTELVRSGIVESYGIVELLLYVEEEFGINFPDEMITPDNFRNVTAIVDVLTTIKGAGEDGG
jgi:acyl carrier protein